MTKVDAYFMIPIHQSDICPESSLQQRRSLPGGHTTCPGGMGRAWFEPRVSDASHTGWGASCQRVHTGGSMVPSGEELPYQLPGAPGYFAGGEELFERSIQQTSDRQPDSSFVHKQSGQDCFRPSSDFSQGPLNVVSGERHPTVHTTSPREGEHHSGLGVESDE